MFVVIAILVLALYIYLGRKQPVAALVTSPFVAGTIFFVGAAEENTVVVVIAPLIFLAAIVVVLASKREPDSEQWTRICAKWVLLIFLCLLLSAVTGIAFGPLGIIGIAFFVLFVGSIIAYGLTSRHATATYVISTIGASMRQNLPLPMALESAAGGLADGRSRILLRIHKWLVEGYPLSESIRRGYPKCPGYASAMIAVAERIDQLPSAIKALEADMVAKADERRKIRPVHPIYPVILFVFTFLVLLGVMTFVMPAWKSASEEMIQGAELPAPTRLLMRITSVVAYEFAWLIWLKIVLIVFVIVPVLIYVRFRPRRPQEPYLLSRIGDFIKWHLPILHRFEKNYSLVHVVELLRLSLSAGCTVNEAIDNTLDLDVNTCFKRRLEKWLDRVQRGDNVAAAIRKSRLGAPLAWAFDHKVNQGNTLAILETLESFYRSSYSYYVNLTRFIMWPCIILIMGAMVGFVVYGVFCPIIAMIDQLTNFITP